MDNEHIWDANWDSLGDYATRSAGNRWAFYLIHKICKKATIDDGSHIVDIGCGIGNKSAVLSKLFPRCHIIVVAFSSREIKFATDYYSDIPNLCFKCGDAKEVAKTYAGNIKLLTAFESLEHIEDWQVLLKEWCSFSQKNFLLSTPTGQMRPYVVKLGHYRNFSKGLFESFIITQGYEAVKIYYTGFPFWFPINRDYYNYTDTESHTKNTIEVAYNPHSHPLACFLYRYLSFLQNWRSVYGAL